MIQVLSMIVFYVAMSKVNDSKLYYPYEYVYKMLIDFFVTRYIISIKINLYHRKAT